MGAETGIGAVQPMGFKEAWHYRQQEKLKQHTLNRDRDNGNGYDRPVNLIVPGMQAEAGEVRPEILRAARYFVNDMKRERGEPYDEELAAEAEAEAQQLDTDIFERQRFVDSRWSWLAPSLKAIEVREIEVPNRIDVIDENGNRTTESFYP